MEICRHDVVYKIGIQNDANNKPMFAMCSCFRCSSTISMKDGYEKLAGFYYTKDANDQTHAYPIFKRAMK